MLKNRYLAGLIRIRTRPADAGLETDMHIPLINLKNSNGYTRRSHELVEGRRLAGPSGFEPELTVLETDVLPLTL